MKKFSIILGLLLIVSSVTVQAAQHKFLVIQSGEQVIRAIHLNYMSKGYDCKQEVLITKCVNEDTNKFVEVTVIGNDRTTSLTIGYVKTNLDPNTVILEVMNKSMDLYDR